jgi:hypothetical protein
VLTGNLTYAPGGPAPVGGINIFTPLTGAVVIELKGFSITGPGFSVTGTAGIGIVIATRAFKLPTKPR